MRAVHMRRGGFDERSCSDQRPLQPHRADREILDRARRLRAVKRVRGNRHLSRVSCSIRVRVLAVKGVFSCNETMHVNRLIQEKSPYLLQHAHNPVDWYPGARKRSKSPA